MENKQQLEVSKQFNCSKEALFRAWTEQEQLKQWWKPLGKQLENVTNEINEGGTVKYEFDNGSLTIDGKYEKVDGNNLLEYTWNWHLTADPVEDANYKLSVKFEGSDSNSSISVTQHGFSNEHSIEPHQQGWEQALEQLSNFLLNGGGSGQSGEAKQGEGKQGDQKPPITGYNETPEQEKVAGG